MLLDKDFIMTKYRECFCSDSGKLVLGDILINAGFFDDNHTIEQIAQENLAKQILRDLGVYHKDNIKGLIDKMMELPAYGKREPKQETSGD